MKPPVTRPGKSPGKSKDDKPAEEIGRQAKRMQARRDYPEPNPLRGIATFGMIGWSVAVPTVGGAFLGTWLDRVSPQDFSWSIALILGGVVLGGFIAWSQIDTEGKDR